MLIQAKDAQSLAQEFDWVKFTVDNVMQNVLNAARTGYLNTSFTANREMSETDLKSVLDTLKKAGYSVTPDTYNKGYHLIAWK